MIAIETSSGWTFFFVPVVFPNGLGPFPLWNPAWGINPSENPFFNPESN